MKSKAMLYSDHGRLTARDILVLTQVPEMPRHFLLSPFERPVNVASQQMRALNLVHALFETRTLAKGDSFAVVGAGVAGVTAAAYAAARGCAVIVLEKEDRELKLFCNSERYLHPRLFEWPFPEWRGERAELPVMTWRPGSGRYVAAQLMSQWTGWKRLYGTGSNNSNDGIGIEVHCGIRDIILGTQRDQKWPATVGLSWIDRHAAKSYARNFSAVLLSVGFGEERPPVDDLATGWRSYWNQSRTNLKKSVGRVLVVGNGDGGVADALHVIFKNFDYRHVARMLNDLPQGITDKVLAVEAQAQFRRDAGIPDRSQFVTEAYISMAERLHGHCPFEIKPRTSLVIAGTTSCPITDECYPLHRLLFAFALNSGAVRYEHGRVRCIHSGDTLRVFNEKTQKWLAESFNYGLFRGGPTRTLAVAFPDIYKRSEAILGFRSGLQQVKRPLWPVPIERVAASSHRAPLSGIERRSVLYSDFLDPYVQNELRNASKALCGDDTEFNVLYRGRLRLMSLLADEVLILSQQLLDGQFFRNEARSLEGNTFQLSELRWVLRRSGRLREDARELFVKQDGLAKPFWMYSLDSGARTLYQALRRLRNDQKKMPPTFEAVLSLLAYEVRSLAVAMNDLRDSLAAIESHLPTSRIRRWRRKSRFQVGSFYDPGWRFSNLKSDDARFQLVNIFKARNSGRPRMDTHHELETALRRGDIGEDDFNRIRSWFNRAYHASLGATERASVIETVWLDHDEWDHIIEVAAAEGGPKVVRTRSVVRRLAELNSADWAALKRSLRDTRSQWRSGTLTKGSYLAAIQRRLPAVPSEVRRLPARGSWERRLALWLDGDIEYREIVLPSRVASPDGARVLILETAGGEPLSLTTYAASLWGSRA